jgi:aldehyde:ferredoxin oxidoreductase
MGWQSGEILWVDLSRKEIRREPTAIPLYEGFAGGWGINAKLSYDLVKPEVPPLSPETPIIISPGFLTGTPCPGTPKAFMTTKCPSTGTVSTAVGGLHFGSRLMWAGYEHLIITGRAEKPVYLKIVDENVEICDAAQIWGKDLYEASDWLRGKHGDDFSRLAIGPAGENLVNISIALIDKGSTFGRTFGASLGSKNLKAIVVKGTKGRRVADEQGFKKAVQRLVEKGMQDPIRDKWRKLAIHLPFAMWEEDGSFQQKNYSETVPKEEFTELYGPKAYLNVKRSSYCCPSCLTGDKAVIELKEGEFAGLVAPFSTPLIPLSCFGGRNAVGSIGKAYKCGDLANRYGIDICTFSALLGFTVELYERGIINKEDTDGFEPRNDFETVVRLMDLTTQRKGLGEILAGGFKGAISRIGRGCEKYACQIKGTETDFDARVSLGVEAFTAVVNPRPSHDMPIGGLTVAKGRKPEFFEKVVSKTGYVPEDARKRVFPPSGFDLPRLTAHYENWAALLNIMGICWRMQVSALYNVNTCAELYSLVTGINKSPEDILKGAERSFNIYKAANVREGFSRKDDRFPGRWFEPLKRPDRGTEITLKDYFGTTAISREDTERMLDSYYEERGWDVGKGVPTRQKLEELNLDDVAKELENLGFIP